MSPAHGTVDSCCRSPLLEDDVTWDTLIFVLAGVDHDSPSLYLFPDFKPLLKLALSIFASGSSPLCFCFNSETNLHESPVSILHY